MPLDTTLYTPLHRELAAKSAIINSSLRYIDNHRKKLKKQYPTFDTFKQNFEISQEFIDDVLAEGAKQNVKPKDDDELQRTLPQLKLQLKALIARDLWDMSQYFSVTNEQNKIVEKALEVINYE